MRPVNEPDVAAKPGVFHLPLWRAAMGVHMISKYF